jgi:hypothetical protein
VRREKRLSGHLEVFLRGSKKSINPGQPSLLAVIGVKDDRNSVKLGNLVNVLGSSNGSGNRCLVVVIVDGLSSNELSTSLGEGDNDGSSVLGCGLHTCIDRVGSNNVDSWNGIPVGLGIVKKINKSLSGNNTRLDSSRKLGESL